MNNDKIRIAIAEICGWTEIHLAGYGDEVNTKALVGKFMPTQIGFHEIPDYPNCLNAMHEAEATLGSFEMPMECDSLTSKYWNILCDASNCYVHATARQRAEAFLRLHGKWVEEKQEANHDTE
jgi:hypothetical protein